MSWNDAEYYCKGRGGHLASIHTPEDNIYLVQNYYNYNFMGWNTFWIGAKRKTKNSPFVWADNSLFDYNNITQGFGESKITTGKFK